MSLEYAEEAARQGQYEEAQAWALVSMADDLYSALEHLAGIREELARLRKMVP